MADLPGRQCGVTHAQAMACHKSNSLPRECFLPTLSWLFASLLDGCFFFLGIFMCEGVSKACWKGYLAQRDSTASATFSFTVN